MSRHPAGSLTKEFPFEKIAQTILHITPNMTYSDLRKFASTKTNKDIPAILKNRFLLLRNDQILYDELLSLINAEGIDSPRVRKVMYFIWAFRDKRIREFILKKLANKSGIWIVPEITKKTNADFFLKYSTANTTSKIRSNYEYSLVEAGIYDELTTTVHLELEDNWLFDAMRVAAQHEPNPVLRRMMLSNPAEFLILKGWQGLANATVEMLRDLPPIVPESPDPLEDSPLEQTGGAAQTGKVWNKSKPKINDRQTAVRTTNPVFLERAYASHHLLETIFADAVRAAGKEPLFNDQIDIYVLPGEGSILAEMKSCQNNNLHAQVRRGISQLLEYRYVYKSILIPSNIMVMVLETRPTADKTWLVEYAKSLDIIIAWKESGSNRLVSSSVLPSSLSGIVHRVELPSDSKP